jgi:hypothetical protein
MKHYLRVYILTFAIRIGGGATADYDRIARIQNQQWDSQTSLVTVTCQWLRPWAFEVLSEDDAAGMKAKYPNGCFATILNDNLVVDKRNEDLDKHWKITHHPLANFIHADPMGKPLAPIQEIRNEATDLALETFEQSIPETYADPDVLNFEAYSNSEARPGMKYPAKPKPGRSLGDSFYTSKTATVNEEIEGFIKRTDIDGQFVVGSFPSIYGGPAQSGSKTAKEYSESRAMALQRLNVIWVVVKNWWAEVMGCAVQLYIDGLIEDERIVKSNPDGTGYVNYWIRQAQLSGKIGRVEADAEEELPTSYAQVKSAIMELITLQSPEINEALFHPQNSEIIKKAIGIPEAYIPGADDRNQQYGEIEKLLLSGPLPTGEPTVSVDLKMNNHAVHMEVIKAWATDPTGIFTKEMNPEGYANVMAHYNLHEMALSMLQAQQPEVTPGKGDAESNADNNPAGDANV